MKKYLLGLLLVLLSTGVWADYDKDSTVAPKTLKQALLWVASAGHSNTIMSVTQDGKIWFLLSSVLILCEYNPNGDSPCHAVK